MTIIVKRRFYLTACLVSKQRLFWRIPLDFRLAKSKRLTVTALSAALSLSIAVTSGCASTSQKGKVGTFSLPHWMQKEQKPKKTYKDPGVSNSLEGFFSQPRVD